MSNMLRKSFTINPDFCIIDTNFKKPKSICLFDTWSLHHFFWQGFFYIILHHLFNIKDIRHSILLFSFLTLVHIIEEYLGNTNKLSIEGIVIDKLGPIIDPKIKPELREIDNDYLDNSIGDVLSGIISNILIIFFWYKYKTLPYYYLLGIFPIFINLLSHSNRLY
jgi:hypothetical protein